MSQFPANWDTVAIGDVFNVQLGKMLSKKAKTGTSSYRYLGNKNVQWNRVDIDDLQEMDFTAAEREKFALRPGDLLVCEGGEVGRTAVWRGELEDCFYQKALHRLRSKKGRVHPEFMLRFMRLAAERDMFAGLTSQTSIAHLTKEKLETLEMPLPPLPEQKRIAAILDKADAIRRKRQQAIRLTEELLRSAFLDMFGDPVTNPKGWEVKKFGDLVADTQLGLVRAAAEQGSDREYEYVRMDSISRDGLLNLCNLNRIDASASEVTKCGLKRGDLLFNTRNTKELVGKTAVYRGDGHHVFNNNIMRVRFRPGVASDYVNRYLLSRLGRRELEKRKAGTTSVFAIYYKQLATLPVLVPPASLQSAYSRAVDHILRTRERGERHGELLVETGNALTQRAFSGRL